MPDSGCSFAGVDRDLEIYWGAYLGSKDEILMHHGSFGKKRTPGYAVKRSG
jgi:hypothetical protein